MKPFEIGQEVVGWSTDGYDLTQGKHYIVLEYCPPYNSGENPFTWPAYVRVRDDNGKIVSCHAKRFKEVE